MKLARRQPALKILRDDILGAIRGDGNTGNNDPYTNNNNNNNRDTFMQIKLNDISNFEN